jgi:hypothetical protein
VAAANQKRLDEIVSLKTQAQEVSDLESLIDEAAYYLRDRQRIVGKRSR